MLSAMLPKADSNAKEAYFMRASGIIMHITSLPSPHGIGTLGKEAREFADFLEKAGQKYWQILPLGPTGYGDSPYQSDSTFAGNPYLIDLEQLIEDGLLTRGEVESVHWGDDPGQTDYGALYAGRFGVLRRAYERGWEREHEKVEKFYRENESWLRSYALYTAAKKHFGQRPWIEWDDEDLRLRRSEEVLLRYEDMLRDDRRFCIFTQYLFFRQWNALREYIREKGLKIIGDVPIYVPLDSADVWSDGQNFQLDDECRPVEVAGCPPDGFTADGQLWGNPIYDWDHMKETGFDWWIRRLRAAGKLYDVVRIDHFRGLESYWAVPYGDKTARNGRWRKGPGEDFITAVKTALPELDLIAEDLGYMTQAVIDLREFSGYPGMKVLEFAFDAREPSAYQPHTYPENCICYTGTHDNATVAQWLAEADSESVLYAKKYLGLNDEEGYVNGILRAGMGSVAKLFVAQMQDWLSLGAEARMNVPGLLGHGNWCWRMQPGTLTDALAERIAGMTEMYGR